MLGSCTAGGAYVPAMADESIIVRWVGGWEFLMVVAVDGSHVSLIVHSATVLLSSLYHAHSSHSCAHHRLLAHCCHPLLQRQWHHFPGRPPAGEGGYWGGRER